MGRVTKDIMVLKNSASLARLFLLLYNSANTGTAAAQGNALDKIQIVFINGSIGKKKTISKVMAGITNNLFTTISIIILFFMIVNILLFVKVDPI